MDSIYENGLLKPKQPVALPEGAEVQLTIRSPRAESEDPLAHVIGIGQTDGAPSAARHDELLYGLSRGVNLPT